MVSVLWVAAGAISRAILFDPRLRIGIVPLGSEGKRAANTISHVREVGLSQNVVGVAPSK
jgi:hypothetical protein